MERLDDDFPDFHLSLGAASHIAEQLPRDAVMTFLTAGTPITDAGTIITGTVIVIGIDQARRIVPANHVKLPELLRKPNSANKFVQ